MNGKYPKLVENLQTRFGDTLTSCVLSTHNEVTIEINKEDLITVCTALRDDAGFAFEQLIDLCAVDYIAYGDVEWQTDVATEIGFSRGRTEGKNSQHTWQRPRFAVVYHLISYTLNQRLRVRSFVDESMPMIDSVTPVWNCADWFEREAFDLMGIIFEGHPDLRRLLTDYGFIGHPFRKDFPLIGQVEMRYDAELQRVVYEPVNIEPRVLVPRVIRDDDRYAGES